MNNTVIITYTNQSYSPSKKLANQSILNSAFVIKVVSESFSERKKNFGLMASGQYIFTIFH